MSAVIGSFSFDAMRGRANPDVATIDPDGRLIQRGITVPTIGTITTETLCDNLATVASTAALYRASIGDIVSANINGSSIARVLVLDCVTSVYGARPKMSLMAEWKLAAGVEWEP